MLLKMEIDRLRISLKGLSASVCPECLRSERSAPARTTSQPVHRFGFNMMHSQEVVHGQEVVHLLQRNSVRRLLIPV
jgi:hypothetical protein